MKLAVVLGAHLGLWLATQDRPQELEVCRDLFDRLPAFDERVTSEQFNANVLVGTLVSYHHHAEQAAIEVLERPEHHWSKRVAALYVLGETRSPELFKFLGRPMDARERIFLLQAILKRGVSDEHGSAKLQELESLVKADKEHLATLSAIAASAPAQDARMKERRARYALTQEATLAAANADAGAMAGPAQVLVHEVGVASLTCLVETFPVVGNEVRVRIASHLISLVDCYRDMLDAVQLDRIQQVATDAALSDSFELRRRAVELFARLAELGDARSDGWLQKLTQDPDPFVAAAARGHLDRIARSADATPTHAPAGSIPMPTNSDGVLPRTPQARLPADASRQTRDESRSSPWFPVSVIGVGALLVAIWGFTIVLRSSRAKRER